MAIDPDVKILLDGITIQLTDHDARLTALEGAAPPPPPPPPPGGAPFPVSDPAPAWLPDEGSLPVVEMDVAASEAAGVLKYGPPPGGLGFRVSVPAGDWRHLGHSFYPQANQGYREGALVVFFCPDGRATLKSFDGANRTGVKIGLRCDGINYDRGGTGVDAFRPVNFDYVQIVNFEITGTKRSGILMPPWPTVFHAKNGLIHHVGGGGFYHGIYTDHLSQVVVEGVSVHSLGTPDPNNGGHCLKLYGDDVRVFNCELRQAGPGEATGGHPGWHSVFAPLDIGAYGQSTIAGTLIERNSDDARNEILSLRNRVFAANLPQVESRPWRCLFAHNTVLNPSAKPSAFALWNNGTWPGLTAGAPPDWAQTYADWGTQDAIIYVLGNTGLEGFGAVGNTQPFGDPDPAHAAPILDVAAPEPWMTARLGA